MKNNSSVHIFCISEASKDFIQSCGNNIVQNGDDSQQNLIKSGPKDDDDIMQTLLPLGACPPKKVR